MSFKFISSIRLGEMNVFLVMPVKSNQLQKSEKIIKPESKIGMGRRHFLKKTLFATSGFYISSLGRHGSAEDDEVEISIDRGTVVLTSNFNIGVTHTGKRWEDGNGHAVERAKKLLMEGLKFHNQHLMNWGVGNPEPAPGKYNWDSLDGRMELIRSMKGIPVITFCSAPGWMNSTGDDIPREISPDHWEDPRVKDEYVAAYAGLCQKAALRYTDVKYFQIWNELKGYWDHSRDQWDYVRFTEFYNTVYEAVKSVRPDAWLGGPYYSWDLDPAPRDWEVIDYWFAHNHGAEFVNFDGWIGGYPPSGLRSEEAKKMLRTDYFGKIAQQFRSRTTLPVWISEFYGGWSDDPQFTAANHASCYLHALMKGVAIALLWGPSAQQWNYLFTDTDRENGGEPSPHYEVVKIFNTFFGPGTKIVGASSSSLELEVLASPTAVYLINKRDKNIPVKLE